MVRVQLIVDDPTQRMTLQAMLVAEGHIVSEEDPEVIFCDSTEIGLENAQRAPTIVLATASEIPEVARAMGEGVWGYVFVPLQPREAALAVQRASSGPQVDEAAERGEPEEMKSLEEVEADYIQTVLRKCKRNQARAARVLRIGRNTLWRKLKKSGPGVQGDAPD